MKQLVYVMLFITTSVFAKAAPNLQAIVDKHHEQYTDIEHFSAIQVSIKANNELQHYTAGTVSREPNSKAVTPSHLFEIGSITKSYTSALVMLADAEKKLGVSDQVKKYLNAYPDWGNLPLTRLLNMTSGLPNYSDSPTFNYLFSQNINQFWGEDELISLVYTRDEKPPLKEGYFYTNTGYILLDMILSDQYNQSFKDLLIKRIFKPLGLKNTYYPVPSYSPETLKHKVQGYSYNIYDNPELVGKNVTLANLSWGGAAGGIVANSEDVINWVDALFVNDKLLNKAQKHEMQQLISVQSGKPIHQVDENDPRGFGLGIVSNYDKSFGQFWFYEGETFGYRSLYMHVPCNKVTIVALFNSGTNGENDHAGKLMTSLYGQLLKNNPPLQCKS